MTNEFIFSELPIDIIINILDYTGKLYYYNGKYIGKLDKNDKKYDKIKNIPKPIKISWNKYNLYLINKSTSLGYILHYTFDSIKSLTNLQLIFYRNNNSKTIEWYIMPSIYSKWRRVISSPILNQIQL
jgi:hypothetical protein